MTRKSQTLESRLRAFERRIRALERKNRKLERENKALERKATTRKPIRPARRSPASRPAARRAPVRRPAGRRAPIRRKAPARKAPSRKAPSRKTSKRRSPTRRPAARRPAARRPAARRPAKRRTPARRPTRRGLPPQKRARAPAKAEHTVRGQRYAETRLWNVTRETELSALRSANRWLRELQALPGPVYVNITLTVRMRVSGENRKAWLETEGSSMGFVVKVPGARVVRGYPIRRVPLTHFLYPANPNVNVQELEPNLAALWGKTGLIAHSLVQIRITATGKGV